MTVFDAFKVDHNAQQVNESLNSELSTTPPRSDEQKLEEGEKGTPTVKQQDSTELMDEAESVESDAAKGTQKMEALAIVWSKKAMFLTYIWIWICFFMLSFQSSILGVVIYAAYNGFETAPQVTTANILATIVGGVMNLPIARLVTIWGRSEGFVLALIVYLIGLVVIASCTGPNGYAAGYTLFWVGYNTLFLIMDVFMADTCGLKNRAFAFAFSTAPTICTAFTGPLAATAFLNGPGWRWAFYSFLIIMPFVLFPLVIIFKTFEKKAFRMGLIKKRDSGRKWYQSVIHYIHEFDIIGAFILMAAFILFLLPFSLTSYGRAQYKSATFIVMLILGVLLFPVFALWEKYLAKEHFVRYELFKKRTVLGACLLAFSFNISYFIWDQYFYNFAIVVYNLNTTNASYMQQIYGVGSCFWAVVIGVWIRYIKFFKWTCFCFGLPLTLLGVGLLIHFGGKDTSIGYMVMSQIFIAFGGGTLVIGWQMAVMAASNLDGIPMMLALVNLFANVGAAIGTAIIAAIYNNIFTETLTNDLPDDSKDLAYTLFLGGYASQMMYLPGTPVRDAVDNAWRDSQKKGYIAATSILVLAIPAVLFWKNYNVDRKQNKGNVL